MVDQPFIDGLSRGMWMRRARGSRLVSAKTATELVRMIVRDEYGQEELDRNEPLSAREVDGSWFVEGAPGEQHALARGGFSGAGPIYARVAKFDGQILDYNFILNYGAGSTSKPSGDAGGGNS